MRKGRSAYSLLEVVLVCVILVIIGAVAIPVARNMFATSNLRAAQDTVRTSLTQTRSLAVRESRSYCFEIRDNSGNYRIRPEDAEGAQPGLEYALPDDVIFCCGTGSDWTPVAVFLPDGTATEDAEIRIRTPESEPVTLRLRATTGTLAANTLLNKPF